MSKKRCVYENQSLTLTDDIVCWCQHEGVTKHRDGKPMLRHSFISSCPIGMSLNKLKICYKLSDENQTDLEI
jgi:hypothetical protein